MTTNRRIARASLILMLASGCGYLLALGKEMMVAAYFGVTGAMDAYCAAITIPALVGNVLLSTFSAVFIPVFVRYRLKDREEANRIASAVSNYLLLVLAGVSFFLVLFAPWIIHCSFRGLPAQTSSLAASLLRVVGMTVLLGGAIGIMTGILNAGEHFARPAFSSMCVTASIIICVIVFNGRGIFALAYGLLAGLVVQFFVLAPALRAHGYRHSFTLDRTHPAVREMSAMALLIFASILAFQLNTVVDRVMASYLAAGSIAALGYAEKLVNVPLAVFSASIATAVFPFFSAQAAERKLAEMTDSLARSIRMVGFIFIPLTAMLIMLGNPLIQLLFGRGAFDRGAVTLTSAIFICYSFQLFFYTAGLILARVYLVFQDMATIIKISSVGVLLNVLLNIVFIKIISPPAAGIALSTSLVYFVTMVCMVVLLRRHAVRLEGRSTAICLAKTVFSAAVMMAGIRAVLAWPHPLAACPPGIALAVRIASAGVAGAILFIASASLLGLEEPRALRRLARDICGRVTP